MADAGKKVVYVLPNPILQFDVKHCLRPVRISGEEVSCRQTADAYLEAGGATYRKWALGVLTHFPQVRVVDLAADFCDERFCPAIKDDELLYRNSAHLSIAGSMIAAKTLRPLLLEALKSPNSGSAGTENCAARRQALGLALKPRNQLARFGRVRSSTGASTRPIWM